MYSNIGKVYLFRFFKEIHFFGAVGVPFFLDWLQVSYTQIFLLQAWFSGWVFLLEIPTGVVADKHGRKVSLLLGVLSMFSAWLLFGLVRNYYALYLAEFVAAAGFALVSGADRALLYDSLLEEEKKDKKLYLSRYEAAATLATLLGFPIGSAIANSSILEYPATLPLTFLLTAATALVAAVITSTFREPKRETLQEKPLQAGIEGFKFIFREQRLRPFALNSVIIGALTFFIFWFYQPVLGEANVSLRYYGFVAAGFNLLGFLLLLNVRRVEEYFSMESILLYTALIPGILLVGMAVFNNALFVIFSIIGAGGLKMLRQPILVDFMNQHIESANRATVLSGVSMLERMIVFILYPLVGLVADVSVSYVLLGLGVLIIVFSFTTRIEASHL